MLAGIFVGGASRRMGGRPKGLLRGPDGLPLVERWRRLFGRLGVRSVLVGRHDAYAPLGAATLDDDPPGIGPLGGLVALLAAAGGGPAVAVACDMPFVDDALVRRLIAHPSAAAVLAPRVEGRWQPLFARYAAPAVLPLARARAAGGQHALQGLLDALGAEAWPLTDAERDRLRDWDTPRDMNGA